MSLGAGRRRIPGRPVLRVAKYFYKKSIFVKLLPYCWMYTHKKMALSQVIEIYRANQLSVLPTN